MQQPGGDGHGIEFLFGKNERHRHRMGEKRLAGFAHLVLVGVPGKPERLFDQVGRDLRVDFLYFLYKSLSASSSEAVGRRQGIHITIIYIIINNF